MVKWMLIWQILNGGVVISGLTFDTQEACVKTGASYGHIPSYSVDDDGDLEKLGGTTVFRCVPVKE